MIALAGVLAGCNMIQRLPAGEPMAHQHDMMPDTNDPAAMATHEAQMQEPAAQATHEALLRDPAALATHEAEMHGTPTPVPPAAASVALSEFTTADFAGSGLCVMCHQDLTDAANADVSITGHWRSTMMANAAKDPAWRAKVASETARTPALQDVIEQKCAACHVPMAATQAKVGGQAVTLSGNGLLSPANPLHAAAQDGVSCALCHQIQPANLGTAKSFSGGYEIDTSTAPPNRIMFGPYQNPFGRPMQMHTGYLPAFGAHTNSAAFCATCHNLITPFVDANGQLAGEFPEQMPFTEWQNSAFGAGAGAVSCQACHMPQANGGVIISPMPARLAPRQPFFQHQFVGGNAFMVNLLKANAAALGVTATADQMAATAARTADQLARGASLGLVSAARDGGSGDLVIKLQINPATGHKLPTSFPSRRAWLHVTVSDSAGKIVFESGRPQADGSIAGNAADADPTAFEPHYDLITQPDQVQIYEPIMADTTGKVTYTLLRAAAFAKDNRLLPAGADKARLPAEIAVRGQAAQDANFTGGSDQITYRIAVASSSGPLTVQAELLYQPLSYRFIQDMLADSGANGRAFAQFLAAADRTPNRIAALAPVKVP
jgi:hypothetical protein